jgi:hypothetical protein
MHQIALMSQPFRFTGLTSNGLEIQRSSNRNALARAQSPFESRFSLVGEAGKIPREEYRIIAARRRLAAESRSGSRFEWHDSDLIFAKQ